MMKTIPLLPNRFRYVGVIFLVLGVMTGYLYFFGGKPEFFVTRIFAFITSYLETRYWVIAQTNLLDEIAAVFTITGLTMLGYSKEKDENDEINALRFKALIYSTYFSIVIWVLFFLFVYGWPIFLFSSSVFLIFLVSNLLVFNLLKYRYRKSEQLKKYN